MSNPEYTIQAASPTLSSDIIRFFEEFYIITDNPAEQENYVDQYTPDAVFIRGGAEPTRGATEIRAWRQHAFDYMKSCKHIPHKIFSLGSDSNEVMLYGRVTIGHLNLQISEGDYAVRAILEKGEDSKLRLAFYEVFMDVYELSKAGAL
ncbi:hypothetical protein BHE90_001934 [Fusarium euwallaceae]|uniref:SnoaL-like domain-containing protein n=1 Tax=Fusarium euwallaceae TaxID=1147111 RepID=A0A430M6E2_9HYPO|nr:hypothetical protein BHE90_001934 [Fusarium euwallaceae]